MAHFSEMDFLFSDINNRKTITQQLDNTNSSNRFNIFKGSPYYVVYKQKPIDSTPTALPPQTNNIKTYLQEKIYNDDIKNPYIKLLEYFNKNNGEPGAGLKLKAADLAYLRELGVYPINRMAILRRFPEGSAVPEDLNEMYIEPISTIIGWIKPDESFGKINFNETWSKTNQRFDVKLVELVKRNFGGIDLSALIPIPDFAQGMLFEFYNRMNLTQGPSDLSNDEIELYKTSETERQGDWGLMNIPVGNPNVLQEGPFRDPLGQNIKSDFTFTLTTIYEQKLLGDVDPGSAILDIIDNIFAMGTSNMLFYWNENSPTIKSARTALEGNANSLSAWWNFLKTLFESFWDALLDLFNDVKTTFMNLGEQVVSSSMAGDFKKAGNIISNELKPLFQSILASTVAIHRFELRGTIELMVGGKISSTPWYLTIGNPYSPWLATNHIIVTSCEIETSTEMGFNDQPQWVKATFTCQFSRSLGKQELMRMFNNTFRRTYTIDNKSLKKITQLPTTPIENKLAGRKN